MKTKLLMAMMTCGAMWMTSCAPSTPEARIRQRPDVFNRLDGKDRELVSRGEVAEGMSKDAVAIAWGRPSDVVDSLRDGKTMERWDYEGSKPVFLSGFSGGYGTGTYGGYSYRGAGVALGPQVAYVPYRRSSVWFRNDRVDAWERTR